MKKNILIVLIIFLALLIWASFFIQKKETEIHLAIIPHFMVETTKVDEFYSLIKDKRYSEFIPDHIVLISPNHFFQQNKEIWTICKKSKTWYLSDQINLSPFPNVWCDLDVFWNWEKIKEHGLWSHFRRINKYFSWTEIYPLVYSSYEMSQVKNVSSQILKMKWSVLVIASVDFSHYLPEKIATQHDNQSITCLQSWTWTEQDFYKLDVDCPSCLFTINEIWKKIGQSWQFRYRDSSSTVFWKDLGKDNTSRVFMYYE